MAKILNSVSFTVLLLVLVMASTGFLKSEAIDCDGGCSLATQREFLGECEEMPLPVTDVECCNCCKRTFTIPPLCWAVIEGTDKHCHCYKKKAV